MIKGTTTIKADDTNSAMEKVVSQLGEDCVILSTKKKDGKIEITASNSYSGFLYFTHVFWLTCCSRYYCILCSLLCSRS